MDFNSLLDFIITNGIATEKECSLVCCINGSSIEILNDIIYARTGYHDAQQLYDCDPESYDFSMLEIEDED